MDERVRSVGGVALVGVGAEARRPEYGLVFCELPPRNTGPRRPAKGLPVARRRRAERPAPGGRRRGVAARPGIAQPACDED